MDVFTVLYRLTGTEEEAAAKAKDITYEQTVEFPADLIRNDFIEECVVGKVKSLSNIQPGHLYEARIDFPVNTAANELTQLFNVIFGNISIKPGIVVQEISLPQSLLSIFRGPRFGIDGLRKLVEVYDRPLLATAIKPMGLDATQLAKLAYTFALGGIDLIKDDHGLTNQSYACFEERVRLCANAVAKANAETGRKCIYVANITAPNDQLRQRAVFAKKCGAGAIMVAPMLIGFDAMRTLADDNEINLPILSHPSFMGSFVTSPDNGISHFALFGQMMRLSGADIVIFPSFGGRFAFSKEQCSDIAQGSKVPMGNLKPIWPAAGGGMTMERIPDMLSVYGDKDVIYLIGGGLFRRSDDIVDNCRYFVQLVSNNS